MKATIKHLLSSLLILAIAPGAFAQDQRLIVLDEIIVTASKRANTLQDTSIAVTVTSADTIEKAQIQDVFDLQTVVPSLRVSQQQTSRNTNFRIRGFGNGANNPGIEPSVGVFVDGVYRSRSAASISDLPRLERVEVLSGPQSTLFGKNASAGIISVITPVPDGNTGGYISGSIGDYNALVLKGLYEGSLAENLAFDISGSYNARDGYFKNLALDQDLNERNRYAVRGQLFYTPTDKTSIRILADYDELDEACCNVVNVVSSPSIGIINSLGGQLVPDAPEATTGFYDVPAINEVSNGGISIQLDHEMGNVALTSITALRRSENLDSQDIDFTSAELFSGSRIDYSIDTFTQELRLASNNQESKIDWLVGGYYFDESVDLATDATFGPAFRPFTNIGLGAAGFPLTLNQVEAIVGAPQGSFFQQGTGTATDFTLDNQAISLFGQLEFSLTNSLTATLGLNYTKDEKEFTGSQELTDLRANLLLPGVLNLIPTITPNFIDLPNAVEGNQTDDDDTTYIARLVWEANNNLNLYATYATGFKASSVNLSRDAAPTAADFQRLGAAGLLPANARSGTRFAGPEESTVYELGLKALFNRGSFNLALFDQEIRGFQDNLFVGSGFNLINAGQQSVKGAEFDLTYLPTNSLTLGLRGTFLDPIYDEFSSNPAGDLTGERPRGISDVALSFSAQYEFTLAGFDAFIRGDYKYVEDAPLLPNFPTSLASSEIKQLNLSAGFTTSNDLSVTFWGRNLTDHEFLWSIFPTTAQPGSFSGFRNEPRTFGVTVRKDY